MAPSKLEQVRAACKFRSTFPDLDLKDQAAFIRNCVEILGPAYREEVLLRDELRRWIEAD